VIQNGPRTHWDAIYEKKRVEDLSWTLSHDEIALRIIRERVPQRECAIVDVGAGRSALLCDLARSGYRNLTAVDIAPAAFKSAERKDCGVSIREIVADVRELELPANSADVWHDRATFHFFTEASDRDLYKLPLLSALNQSGVAIIATFVWIIRTISTSSSSGAN
jgi:2-polyprenyl-3-methyl-5-hydroxy-6-metoxy-1,4-benzoquinol methylase